LNSIEPQTNAKIHGRLWKEADQGSDTRVSSEVEQHIAHKAGANCLTIDNNDGRFLISGGAEADINLFDLEAKIEGHVYQPAATISRSSLGAHTHAISALCLYPFDPTPRTLITTS